ncbi:hypothetical protein OIU79_014377 [Salix purpurea]|uniref:Uncharacterized protein n=1 Tax=Salix purpurea TaxID=77065 RepID=A0A9Q0PQM5_SALPP|nr:hypothetical protein OIU79_014377 [Salix purpurea]
MQENCFSISKREALQSTNTSLIYFHRRLYTTYGHFFPSLFHHQGTNLSISKQTVVSDIVVSLRTTLISF